MSDQLNADAAPPTIDRQTLEADIVCVGFGPAMGGFLTTLSRQLLNSDGTPRIESAIAPGLPPQVVAYERAEDVGAGVSGVVTPARAIRKSFPDLDPAQIPTAARVTQETVLYLLDPIGASRRSPVLRALDRLLRLGRRWLPFEAEAVKLPYLPAFLRKHDGWVFSLGQFNQWVANQLLSTGTIQLWPGTPVAAPLWDGNRVQGIRLTDQGTNRQGVPDAGFLPGMDIRAPLTVVGDGPVGAVGQQLDQHLGLPEGHHRHDWAIGMKMVVQLRPDSALSPGTVLHTFGFPEPEIFGFLYVYPDQVAALGIFVPSWFDNPARTAYRYLQHWMLHPALWRHLEGATLRSWGAKSLQESGRSGEPFLAGDGFARIGEGSGSTNVLTGSGVDEAWATGVQLAEGVLDLLQARQPFTRENLEAAYVRRRRASGFDRESQAAAQARNGFHYGLLPGLVGMALAGLTGGRLHLPGRPRPPYSRLPTIQDYFKNKIDPAELARLQQDCAAQGLPLHDALMDRCGWPAIPFDGRLLVSHQDVLLMGGKVQAPAGYADHVVFRDPQRCQVCQARLCIEVCSGQALFSTPAGLPGFEREKCIHCGVCYWNCTQPEPGHPDRTNLDFRAGAGGLHSAEN